ncbi:3-oxo-tetronate kinase [Rhizobium sp. R693]|uniref:3-oxo-tetronate kinase n=1 Tax=Rhizobium sp. R693 TaxID=1764276 RepID=UPI000B52F827|nr:3-oxo-tetronate kinase [Rhizobium sp. R693]OWV86835.1 serine kinase [Rhizobium sp. R693]
MPAMIAAIADDYTGASDLANTWRRNGLRTIQTIGVPTSLDTSGADAIVVSFKIRSVPAEQAVAAATEAYSWLRSIGVRHVMYKVCSTFDSTDRGNIGQVTDALRSLANAGHTLVTPAFPETKRTVYKGHLFVDEVPLNESPLKYHPLNPMNDANLVRVLAKQSKDSVGLLDLATIRAGSEAINKKLRLLEGAGTRSIIADAVAESDLEALGRIAIMSPVSTGASGLGLGLARAVASEVSPDPEAASGSVSVQGFAAIVVGSCSARTLEQIAEAEKVMPVLRLDSDRLVSSDGDVTEAIDWARERLSGGPVLIAASADPTVVRDIQHKYGWPRASHVIETASGRLARALVDSGVRRLIVAGGETSGAVVDHLEIPGFRIGEEIAPGVPVLRTVGFAGGELSMALKSGNFGGVDFFEQALSKL